MIVASKLDASSNLTRISCGGSSQRYSGNLDDRSAAARALEIGRYPRSVLDAGSERRLEASKNNNQGEH